MFRPTPQAWLLALNSELRSRSQGNKDQQGDLDRLRSEQPCLGLLPTPIARCWKAAPYAFLACPSRTEACPPPHGLGTSFLPKTPLPTGSLNRLFALARGIQGEIAGVPAAHRWQGFLLTLLDMALDYRDLLNISRSAFDPAERRLGVGLFTYELHPRTAAALSQLVHFREHLFPWPWNRQTLAKRFEQLFDLAEIPRGVNPNSDCRTDR